MGAIQDALEIFCGTALPKGQRSTACNAGAGGSGLAVQFFGNGQGVTVCIGDGYAKLKGAFCFPRFGNWR